MDLIYSYTEGVLKSINQSIDDLNGRLIAVIGFSGVMLRFAKDLSPHSLAYGLPTIKVLVCILFTIAIASSAIGLIPKSTASVASPDTLLQKWYRETDEQCKLFILAGWEQAITQLVRMRGSKILASVIAATCLVIGTILYGINIALG